MCRSSKIEAISEWHSPMATIFEFICYHVHVAIWQRKWPKWAIGSPDNIAEAGRLRLPGGTYGSLRQSIAAAHSEAGRRRLCQIKNAHATAWWREADAGWLPACRCRPGTGSTGCAGLNAAHGVTTGCQRWPASGCANSTATEMTEPSTAASTRSRLTSQLELQTPVCLNGEKWRAALSLHFQPTLVVYHINCHLVVENQALRVLPNWRESADQVFCRENAPLHQFSSLFTLYTGESNQSIVPEAAFSWS